MKTFFVTGGAGFIGSCFVRLSLEEFPECRVVNFDALTYAGNSDNLEGLDSRRHRFVCGNIADREAVCESDQDPTWGDLRRSTWTAHQLADEFLHQHLGTQILLDVTAQRA